MAFNRERADEELKWFGQSFFEQALESRRSSTRSTSSARRRCLDHGRKGIDTVLAEHELDALVTPSYAPAIPIDLINHEADFGSCTQPTAIAGYPLVTVPITLAHGLPVAVSSLGDGRQGADPDRDRDRSRGGARRRRRPAAAADVPHVRLSRTLAGVWVS